MRKLNLRFLGYLLGAVVLLAPGIHFLHAFQVKRNAEFLLNQSEKAENQGDQKKALDYLRRYIKLAPDNVDALAKLGTLLADDPKTVKSRKALEQAFFVLEQVVRREPQRHDTRKRLVRLAMDFRMQRHTDALDHLKILIDTLGPDSELLTLRAQCNANKRQFKEARRDFEDAMAFPKKEMETYFGLADLLRRHDGAVLLGEKNIDEVHKRAEAVVEELLAAHQGSFRAYLWCAGHCREFAKQIGLEESPKRIEKHIEDAKKLAPNELDVILAYAELEQNRKKTDRARAELERGIEIHAGEWRLYQALSNLEMLDSKPDAAMTVLRRGLEKLPLQLDLRWNLAHLLAHQGEFEEATQEAGRLEKQGFPRWELDYLHARIHARQEKWHSAAQLLEGIYPLLAGRADQERDWFSISLVYESNLVLGRCYEQLGDPDAAGSAYACAVARFPLSIPGRFGLARMEWVLGRLDNSAREYNVLMGFPESQVQAWLECTQLLIDRNAKRTVPDWSEVEHILTQAERLKPRPAAVNLLRAEVFAAKSEYDKASEFLANNPNKKEDRTPEIWIGLSKLEQRRGNVEGALSILNEAQESLGDRIELRQARCRYWSRRGGPEAPRALDQIGQGLERFKEEQKRSLFPILAESYLQIGELKRAEAMWQQIAEKHENDLRSRMALFDLAIQENDQSTLEQLVKSISKIEGAQGTLWRYCKACTLIAAAYKSSDTSNLDEASELLAAVAKRRLTWGRVLVAQGEIRDLRKDYEEAIDKYEKAVFLGEESPALIRRAVQLMWSLERYDDAEALINRLRFNSKGSLGDLDRISAHVALRKADSTSALSLAERAVPSSSKDYRDHIWLGQIKEAAGKLVDAEAELRLAIKLAPDVPEPWVAVASFLMRTGEPTKASQAVADAEKTLSKERNPLAFAMCFEMVGEAKKANEFYQTALAASPNDSEVLRNLAFYCMRTKQTAKAKEHLERIISLKNASPVRLAEANRFLAFIRASTNDYQEQLRALRSLGVIDTDATKLQSADRESLADKRAKIIILARAQNVRQRRQAIVLLEDMLRRNQLTADEQFLLAQLYDSVGDWSRARERFLSLLSESQVAFAKGGPTKKARQAEYANQLTAFCAGLLRNKAISQVEPWLAKLEELDPKSLRALAIRAQFLEKQGMADKAAAELLAFAKDQEKMTGPVAVLLEQIGQVKHAEEMYKKLVTQSKKPEANLTLAQFYGRQNRPDEALALCQAALKTCRVEQVASTAVLVLYSAKVNDEHCRGVAAWLQTAIDKNEKATGLLTDLAAVRRLQKDYRSVVALYREVVKRDPNDTLALNNLAWLLALSDRNGSEAMATIKRAIELDGPQAELLDTRAVVYLVNGESALAVKDLDEAISERPTAHRYFHLAQAQHLAKNRGAAVEALQKAIRLDLNETSVDPLELPAYRQLLVELDVKSVANR